VIILGIDTATDMVSVAVVDGHDVVAASEARSERRHAEELAPMIDFVMSRAGLAFGELGAIAVDVGPGLFTGMRVGIAAAQALAHVLAVPLVGIDGLGALVAASTNGVEYSDHVVVPTIDTRRGEVAWAMHLVRVDGSSSRVMDPRIGAMEDLVIAVRERAQPCLFVGEFALRHREDILERIGPQSWSISIPGNMPLHPHASHIATLTHDALMRSDSLSDESHPTNMTSQTATSYPISDAPSVAALYLREADAEINWVKRSNA
jgi:tRNA threonylcarbamoyladenosine biosynthesis protein TsaB